MPRQELCVSCIAAAAAAALANQNQVIQTQAEQQQEKLDKQITTTTTNPSNTTTKQTGGGTAETVASKENEKSFPQRKEDEDAKNEKAYSKSSKCSDSWIDVPGASSSPAATAFVIICDIYIPHVLTDWFWLRPHHCLSSGLFYIYS